MELRTIPYSVNSAYANIATDHALLESVANGNSYMVLRLYSWKPSAVSVGRFQKMQKEINLERCRFLGVDVARRITGGGVAYHNAEGVISYSIIAKEGELPEGIQRCYAYSTSAIRDALSSLGVRAEPSPINDLLVDGKVISENTQTRREGAVLLQGTIFYKVDIRKILSVIKVSNNEISEDMVKSAAERITDVQSNSHASINELREALFSSFTMGRAWQEKPLTDEEKGRSLELEETVYRNDEWNFDR